MTLKQAFWGQKTLSTSRLHRRYSWRRAFAWIASASAAKWVNFGPNFGYIYKARLSVPFRSFLLNLFPSMFLICVLNCCCVFWRALTYMYVGKLRTACPLFYQLQLLESAAEPRSLFPPRCILNRTAHRMISIWNSFSWSHPCIPKEFSIIRGP